MTYIVSYTEPFLRLFMQVGIIKWVLLLAKIGNTYFFTIYRSSHYLPDPIGS